MTALVHQRCTLHVDREAAVQCPQCKRFFCRECVTEHQGRMLCTSCVAALTRAPESRPASLGKWAALAVAGFAFAWLTFYYSGMMLARIPTAFHEEAP